MAGIGERRGGVGLVLLVSLFAGAAAGAFVAVLMARTPPAGDPPAAVSRAEPASRPAPNGDELEELRNTVRRHSEELARLAGQAERRQALAAPEPAEDRAARIRNLIDRIKHLEHGERHLEIEKAFRELVELGEAVVPDLIALLQSGFDIDYGTGLSISGGRFQNYPRLRTMLMDALRQIGTPPAKQALLDAVRSGRGLADFRDLFVLYGAASDEHMARGIALLLPLLLERMKAEGQALRGTEQALLFNELSRWIRRHQLPDSVPFLLGLLETDLAGGGSSFQTGSILGVLIELSPEQAAAAVKNLVARAAGKGAGEPPLGMWLRAGGGSLTQWSHFLRALFAQVDLSPAGERALWQFALPMLPEKIKDPEKRIADAGPYLDFLEERLRTARSEEIRKALEVLIDGLRRQVEQLGRK